MKRIILSVLLLPLLVTMGAGLATAGVLGVVTGGEPGTSAAPASAGGPGVFDVPVAAVRLYAEAAGTCRGLSWAVPAAIGTIESGNGTSDAPGVHSGANPAGAEGPMQFEPATFAAYAQPVPPGGADPPSPYDMTDAVYAAVRMLCADGAADPATLADSVFDYNHSTAYVAEVLATAEGYGYPPAGGDADGEVALDYALGQLGTPYRWGGETPGVGFDCSGLAQAAWSAAGVDLPRVAQDQFDAGAAVIPGTGLEAGDLVFFGSGPVEVDHVGIVVAEGVMVDAPHTGASVRVESVPSVVGRPWGSEIYLGATNPQARANSF